MKTKVKRLSKRTLATIMTFLMLITCLSVGTISSYNATQLTNLTNVWIADQDSWIDSYAHGNRVLSKVNNDSNRWDTTLYVLGSKTSTYNRYFKMGVKCSGWSGNGYWGAGATWSGNTYEKNIWDRYSDSNDTLQLIKSANTGWIKVKFELYGEYNNDSRLGIYQSTVNNLSYTTISPAKATVSGGENTTINNTASGGSGNYSYSYVVKDSNGNTINNCMSGNTFTAPYVAETTTYTITGTLSDSTITELTTKTKSTTITVNPSYSTTYKLSGTEKLTGTAWAGAKDAAHMMQVGSENYRLVFQNVPAGSHMFKIIEGTDWKGYDQMDGGRTLTGDATSGSITKGTGSNDNNICFTTTKLSTVTIDFKAGTGWKIAIDATVTAEEYTVTFDTSTVTSVNGSTDSPASVAEESTVTVVPVKKAGKVAKVYYTPSGGSKTAATKSGSNYTFTMPSSDVNVSVEYDDPSEVPVTVYANGGGSVSFVYSGVTRVIDEGEHVTVNVLEGDSISLTATPASGRSFSKWKKGLNDSYSNSPSITEPISSSMTYVANFSGSGGSGISIEGTKLTNSYKMVYYVGNTNKPSDLTSYTDVYRLGDKLVAYLDYSSVVNGQNIYFALSNSSSYTGIVEKGGNFSFDNANSDPTIEKVNGYQGSTQYFYMSAHSWPANSNGYVKFELATASGTGATSGYSSVKYVVNVSTSSGGGSSVTDFEPKVNYFAKDGTIRIYNSSFAQYATTTVTAVDDIVTAGTRKNYNENGSAVGDDTVEKGTAGVARLKKQTWLEGEATKGQNITVKTTIANETVNGSNLRNKYYVAGFSFNGVTPKLLEWNASGEYTCTYKIPENVQDNKLEITPIFFQKDSTNTVTFYIDGFDKGIQQNWGHTLYVYPFYQYYKNGSSGDTTTYYGQSENYLGYPGQPVINYGGQRYTQIPLTDNGEAIGTAGSYRVKGVTINNGYWDQIHGNTSGSGDGHDNKGNLGANFVSTHYQTYDYDDFYKIYNEYKNKGSKNLNSIVFTFKYKTDTQHRTSFTDAASGDQRKDDTTTPITTSSYANWEDLTDNYKRKVDIFGTVLSATQANNTTSDILIVSQGYEANNAGKFGTEWAIYKNNGSGSYVKQTVVGGNVSNVGETSIVPSALVIGEADDVSDTDYPGLDGDAAVKDYKSLYKALESLRGLPARISYEGDLHGGGKTNSDGTEGYDPAYRSDGRWTFTRTSDYITSNVKIEYQAKDSNTWTVDNFTSGTATGSTTKTKAYFTYESAEKNGYSASKDGETSITSLVQNDKFYSLKAEAVGNYEFVGWYYKDTNNNYHEVNPADVSNPTAESAMSGSNTYIARFKYVASGSLSISHSLASGNENRGTTYLGVSVGDTDLVSPYTNTASYTLDKSVIKTSNASTPITVTLRTVPSGENTFSQFSGEKVNGNDTPPTTTALTTSDATFGDSPNTTEDGATIKTISFTVGDLFSGSNLVITALDYYSALTAPVNKYEIKYNFEGRKGDLKSYTVKGTFTQGEIKAYVTGSGTDKNVSQDFINKQIPYESNFKKNITWNTSSPVYKTNEGYSSKGWKKTNDANNEYTFKAEVNSTSSDNVDRHAVFSVPYEVQNKANSYNAVVTNSKVAKTSENNTFDVETVYGKWFDPVTKCTSTTTLDGNNHFVSAPSMIYATEGGNEVPYYFSYWKVSTLLGNGKAGKFVTNVYYSDFFYISYDNYFIEAIYDTDPAKAVGNLYGTNNGKELDTTITFLQDSRNEWNEDGHGTADTSFEANKIWNDFAVSFKYGKVTLNDYTDKNVRVGMVVERVGKATLDGDTHAGTNEGYEKMYSNTVSDSIDVISEQLKTNPAVTGFSTQTTANGNDRGAAYYASNIPYASNIANDTVTSRRLSDTNYFDNKNRCEIGYSLYDYNKATSSASKVSYKNKTYVFRAFSYIMVNNGNTWDIALSKEPAYFCMYDTATRTS